MNTGDILSRLRVQHGFAKQRDFARSLGWDPSRVSRIENGTGEPSPDDVREYLTGLNPAVAEDFAEFAAQEWAHISKPNYLHPDRESLTRAESSLKALFNFENSQTFVAALEGRAASLRSQLLSTAAMLFSQKHDVVMIGRIAIGKTTALCFALDLLKTGAKSVSDVVLHASGGRTTLCEVQVRPAERYGILAEPRPDSEVYRLVSEICESAANQVTGKSDEGALSVSKEIDKALRNMAGLQRSIQKVDGKSITVDPIAEELRAGRLLAELISEFSQRLQLWRRTELMIAADPTEKDGKRWLSEISREINLGQNPHFSLPQRVILEIPSSELPAETESLVFVDTKGIDETSLRPDIKNRIDDPRSIIVLCSGFPEAPSPEVLELVDLAVKVVGSKDTEARTLLLVLPKNDEALRIEDDLGNAPDDEAAAFAIRRTIVTEALSHHGAGGIPVHFFNAATGDRAALRGAIVTQVNKNRQTWCDRVEQLALGVEDLIENAKNHHAAEIQKKIGERVARVVEKFQALEVVDEPLYQAVLEGIQVASPRSISASTRRRGEWDNFDVLFLLGRKAETQAFERSSEALSNLKAILSEMTDDKTFKTGRRFLKEIGDTADDARRRFSKEAREIAEAGYREPLAQADELWSTCDNRWGQGSGYRIDLEGYFRKWFKSQGRVRETIESEVQKVWRRHFVKKLIGLVTDRLHNEKTN